MMHQLDLGMAPCFVKASLYRCVFPFTVPCINLTRLWNITLVNSTMSMATFNSKLLVFQTVNLYHVCLFFSKISCLLPCARKVYLSVRGSTALHQHGVVWIIPCHHLMGPTWPHSTQKKRQLLGMIYPCKIL